MAFDQHRYEYYQEQLRLRKLFRRFWIFWALYGILYIPLTAIILVRTEKGWQGLVLAIIAYLLTWPTIAQLINIGYKKQRPYQRFGFTPIASSFLFSRIHPDRYNSFPSRHTMALTAVSGVLLFYSVPLAVLGFVVALIVGTSRVVLGYHYPLDIIAGFALGAASGILVFLIGNPLLFTR